MAQEIDCLLIRQLFPISIKLHAVTTQDMPEIVIQVLATKAGFMLKISTPSTPIPPKFNFHTATGWSDCSHDIIESKRCTFWALFWRCKPSEFERANTSLPEGVRWAPPRPPRPCQHDSGHQPVQSEWRSSAVAISILTKSLN